MSLPIGEVVERSGVAATTLRFYEQEGLLSTPDRVGGRRRYDESVLTRLEVIGHCKAAGFSLEEIHLLLTDNAPGRPASRSLAEAKLTDIDAQMTTLIRAREIIEWAMNCPCPSVDACDCGTEVVSGSPC
ncbi:MAG: MerR family transcriptional regulator [Mycobacterium sp.]